MNNANKMNNLEEINKFLERYNILRLNQEEIEIINRSITNNEIESVILKKETSHTNKSSRTDGFTGEYYQTFKQELMPILKLFPKIPEERVFLNSFYEASITLIPKPDKDSPKKKL